MKKSHIWLGLCLALGLFTVMGSSSAQPAPAYPRKDALRVEGAKAVAALTGGDYQTIYDMLRPAAQGRIALVHERFNAALDDSGEGDSAAVGYANEMDPAGELSIQSMNRLRNLTDPEFLGLVSGVLSYAASRPAETVGLKWHLVDQGQGYFQSYLDRTYGDVAFFNSGEAVAYENRVGEQIAFLFEPEDGDWALSYYYAEVEGKDFTFKSVIDSEFKSETFRWSRTDKARAIEGEKLANSVKGQCRVEYSKTGDIKAVAKAFKEWAENDELDSPAYSVEVLHVKLADSEFDAALEIHPKDNGDPWGLMTFTWGGGNGAYEWFENKTDLEERVSELTDDSTKKDAPPED